MPQAQLPLIGPQFLGEEVVGGEAQAFRLLPQEQMYEDGQPHQGRPGEQDRVHIPILSAGGVARGHVKATLIPQRMLRREEERQARINPVAGQGAPFFPKQNR